MKSVLLTSALTVLIMISTILSSCSDKRTLNSEAERKQLIDAKANELVESENPEIVDQLLNLDVTLDELDMSLQGEAGDFLDGFKDSNQKLTEIKEKLKTLKKDLYDQAAALERLRLNVIEPVVSEALSDENSDKPGD